MVRNYIKIAIRNFVNHRGYTFINVSGLALGIACCLLIMLYVKDEFTYDRYHSNGDRIFRITSQINFSGRSSISGGSTRPEAKAYLDEIPQIESIVRFDRGVATIELGDDYVEESALLYADPSIFDIFDFRFVDGAGKGALSNLNQIVLTEAMAMKYFGRTDVLGEALRLNLSKTPETFYISGVIENHPSNSSFNFDFLMSWAKRESQLSNYNINSWLNVGINSFVLLKETNDKGLVVDQMKKVRDRRNAEGGGVSEIEIVNDLQPLSNLHFNTALGGGPGYIEPIDPVYSYIISGIAFIILIVACINFTNLSLARSLPRVREIGVRKVLGAQREHLAFQFLSEAILMCLAAFVLGLVLAEMALPVFEELTAKTFYHGVSGDPVLLLICLILVILTAFVSGSYPAFIVSRFNTISSLKGIAGIGKNTIVSKMLLVVQFTIATVLLAGTLAMNRQIDFMTNKDLGFDDQNLIRINSSRSGVKNIAQLFKNELSQNPNVLSVAAADDYKTYVGATFGEQQFVTVYNEIDGKYLDAIGAKLVQGRFIHDRPDVFIDNGDTLHNIVVNEAYARASGESDILHKITGGYRIVGVVKDFHYASVEGAIKPLMMVWNDETGTSSFQSIYIKCKADYLAQAQTEFNKIWKKYVSYRPFESEIVEEANAVRYAETNRWKRIITYTSVFAIFISLMGLFGLAHIVTQQRTKEIGVRKVLGASLPQIIMLLNARFSSIVLLSVAVSIPIAYYVIDLWLQNFAYAIKITLLLFAVPGILTLTVAFLTVSLQSLKTARSNPIDALRYE
jgi:putative ABC transport system permease protein